MGEKILFGSSSIGRVLACPASHSRLADIEAKYGEEPTSPDAQWGKDSHNYLKDGINLTIPPTLLAPDDPAEKEKAEMAEVAWEYAMSGNEDSEPCEVFSEIRLNPGARIGREDMGGVADILLVTEDWLEVIDYKTGHVPVEPTLTQNKFLLLGALDQYWPNQSEPCPFERLASTIVQPNHPRGPILIHFYEVDELFQFREEVRAGLEIATGLNPPAHAGEEQCRYCRVKTTGEEGCPEYKAWVLRETLGAAGVDLTAPFNFDSINTAISPEALGKLSAARLRAIYDMLPSLHTFEEAITSEMSNRLGRGEGGLGKKLVRGQGKPKWLTDAKTVIKRLRALKLKKPQYTNDILRTPLQCMGIEGLTEEQSRTIGTLWTRPEGALKIVNEDAPGNDENAWVKSIPKEEN